MTINIKPVPKEAAERREVKKLTIKIVDQEALLAAYPKLRREEVVVKVDKSALRKIVNAYYDVDMPMPAGVEAYYASEKVAEDNAEVAVVTNGN